MGSRLFVSLVLLTAGIGVGAAATTIFSSTRLASAPVDDSGTETAATKQLRDDLRRAEPDQLGPVVDSLIRTLDEEIKERRLLAEEVAELRAAMESFRGGFGMRRDDSSDPATRARQRAEQRSARTAERMVAAGITQQQLDAIQRREAEALMRQIEFDDRARREGWAESPRYFAEAARLNDGANAARQELGDDLYDRYLYASGRPNRLVVANVIDTSPAQRAGFQPGDIIMSYGDERVYSTRQLTELRSSGQNGAPVTVNIVRDGRPMQITMPRGPMGVQTTSTSVDPSAPSGN